MQDNPNELGFVPIVPRENSTPCLRSIAADRKSYRVGRKSYKAASLTNVKRDFLPPEWKGSGGSRGAPCFAGGPPRAVEVSRGVSRREHIRGNNRGPETGRTIKLEIGRTTWLKFHTTSGP